MVIAHTDSSLATNTMVPAMEFLNCTNSTVLVSWFSDLAHKLTSFSHAETDLGIFSIIFILHLTVIIIQLFLTENHI